MKAADGRYDQARALCFALHEENDRQMGIFIEAMKKTQAHSKLLVQNEQLTAELDRMKGDPLPIKLVGKLKDVETSNKTLHSELVEVRAALASVSAERDSLKRTLQEWEEAETEPHVRVDPDIRMGLISETGPAVFVRIGAPPNDDIADHVVPPVLPMCNVCHECTQLLTPTESGQTLRCETRGCKRIHSKYPNETLRPHFGPCPSWTVRHE